MPARVSLFAAFCFLGLLPACDDGVTGFDPKLIDLGQRPWGTKQDFELVFHNGNSKPVQIDEVHATCGCTAINKEALTGQTIAPDQSITIDGVLSVGTKLADLKREISITSGKESFTATIILSVVPTFTLSEKSVDFATTDESEDILTQEVAFLSQEVGLISVSSDAIWLEATQEENRILLSADPALVVGGRSFARVTLETTDAGVPNFVIPVSIRQYAEVNFHPARLHLIGDRRRKVLVTGLTGEPLTIAQVNNRGSFEVDFNQKGVLMVNFGGNESSCQEAVFAVVTEEGFERPFLVKWSPGPRRP
jgi:hypothetical protein